MCNESRSTSHDQIAALVAAEASGLSAEHFDALCAGSRREPGIEGGDRPTRNRHPCPCVHAGADTPTAHLSL